MSLQSGGTEIIHQRTHLRFHWTRHEHTHLNTHWNTHIRLLPLKHADLLDFSEFCQTFDWLSCVAAPPGGSSSHLQPDLSRR